MRDYNREQENNAERQYFYGFDYDVMHPFMVRSMLPFMKAGSLLELGSYEGHLTKLLLDLNLFSAVTCVEASSDAMRNVNDSVKSQVELENVLIENFNPVKRFDNIILTHVLEHLDDPVEVLGKINKDFLSDEGRFFLICPNANAPSRQIAVKMGIVDHNSAVTPGESEHGHRITYGLDTLERDAAKAGLKIYQRTGIFFKALANFQWDQLLQTDIVSKEYLEGCYQLGQVYPDLCSSIMLVCGKGD
ncbi:methyltransferase domain-containing protein [Kiloniella majae]|uniref:methyltransferase domain-containing protein n=1 Tax=Kiloniella majae TaxID=1938558 RepID=UPI000A2789F4|nr:methyltransferase domain-containing protein [Kiloniella majae]